MHQVYEALDKVDGELRYFYFNHQKNMYTVLDTSEFENDEDAVAYFKKTKGDWPDVLGRVSDMDNPVLIAEW